MSTLVPFVLAYKGQKAAPYPAADRARDFKTVFGTDTGQRVLMDLIILAKMVEPVPASDPVMLQRAEGARGLIAAILEQLSS